jgi:hypothetical protein
VRAAKVRIFTLSGGSLTGEEMKRVLVNILLKMGRAIKNNPPAFSARDAAVRGRVCHCVTDRQDVKQGDLPAVLLATKNALSKKDDVALPGFTPYL